MRVGLACILAICTAVWAASAHADSRPFSRQDYEYYFSPGRFETHSPYYGSDGVLEVIARKSRTFAGGYFLEQTLRSFDVSANYDDQSEYPYYKIVAEGPEQLVWDNRLAGYVFETTSEEFDSNDSRVWESRDIDLKVSPGDRNAGKLHPFYHQADRKAGRDVKELHDQHRVDVVGAWTWTCAWLDLTDWDVECAAVHLPTQREELYYYRKADLLG